MDANFSNFPRQMLPSRQKTKKWRRSCVEWANNKTFFNYSLVRKTVMHKQINYNLLRGKLNMQDMQLIINPDGLQASFIPERLQHYPIMNSKLDVLRGEELNRIFDWSAVVTNPTAISEKETNKRNELLQRMQELLQDTSQTEEEFNAKLEELNQYYTYEWQDLREIRANALLKHYIKEYNMPLMFNAGFMDALTVGEEMYQCDIVGGEPVIERLNNIKVRVFKSGYSNRVEDADIIILEDYWSPGKVIDTFYDVLTKKDIEYIESIPDNIGQSAVDGMDTVDERYGLINANMIGEELSTSDNFLMGPNNLFPSGVGSNLLPYDLAGNVRVLRVYWKSKRPVKKVRSYDPVTGEEVYNLYPEDYVINKELGEKEYNLWINEAWEGTLIGNELFVNMRPRVVQYNRISNPSRCHFGIIGTIYNLNQGRPFSLVDIMKPYSYYYDAIHDRLNKAIANNWGNLLRLDFSKVPEGWTVDKWLYYAKINHILIEDSAKEINYGVGTGKLAGQLNNNSTGGISLDQGNYIQQLINLLEFIKLEMGEVVGITRQREGQISNRETVGGIERSTLQSNHMTEWWYAQHDDTKRRALECFLETAKVALKGRSIKFQNILSDMSTAITEIDGDVFAEADYGIVVDNSKGTQELNSKLDSLAQAALQNQLITFSTMMKLYTSTSMAEKMRFVERDEQEMEKRRQESQQQQLESQERIADMQNQIKELELRLQEANNIRDNQTKLTIAQLSKYDDGEDGVAVEYSQEAKDKLLQDMKKFDQEIKLKKEDLKLKEKKINADIKINKQKVSKTNNTK